jgi:hypothetical protein
VKKSSNMATALLFASMISIEEFQAIQLQKFAFMDDEFVNHDN